MPDQLNEALRRAVESGDIEAVRKAVEMGADAGTITSNQIPPTEETQEHYEVMRYLFTVGTDVNHRGVEGPRRCALPATRNSHVVEESSYEPDGNSLFSSVFFSSAQIIL